MSYSSVKSPMAMYSAKTWVGILSNMVWFLGTETGTFTERLLLLLSFTAHLRDISILLYRL